MTVLVWAVWSVDRDDNGNRIGGGVAGNVLFHEKEHAQQRIERITDGKTRDGRWDDSTKYEIRSFEMAGDRPPARE